jgi:hypothetical protein
MKDGMIDADSADHEASVKEGEILWTDRDALSREGGVRRISFGGDAAETNPKNRKSGDASDGKLSAGDVREFPNQQGAACLRLEVKVERKGRSGECDDKNRRHKKNGLGKRSHTNKLGGLP